MISAPTENGKKVLTMAEYIEREAALMKLMQDGCSAKNLQSISDMPAADVAPVVHGRWIYKGDSDMWVCSRCGRSVNADPEGIDLYCYHCGAKMDEKEDKHDDYT